MENLGEFGDVEDVEYREVVAPSGRPAAAPRSPEARSKARRRRVQREQTDSRRIGLQHLAFFRGYLEGLNLADLAEQYLEFGRDARKAASTRDWLVTGFVAAARKRQDFATARLLAIRPAALAIIDTAGSAAPSLEDFAAQNDPDGFHTEKELLELFAAHCVETPRKFQKRAAPTSHHTCGGFHVHDSFGDDEARPESAAEWLG
ncbi:hypothetical protein PQQ88_27475 [Paraburkholderia caledonica]|uniref:hypothetical protein n=1 Tax=Paraburkholderia caledonica TaxID=134536 RepID=UPI0038B7F1D3